MDHKRLEDVLRGKDPLEIGEGLSATSLHSIILEDRIKTNGPEFKMSGIIY